MDVMTHLPGKRDWIFGAWLPNRTDFYATNRILSPRFTNVLYKHPFNKAGELGFAKLPELIIQKYVSVAVLRIGNRFYLVKCHFQRAWDR